MLRKSKEGVQDVGRFLIKRDTKSRFVEVLRSTAHDLWPFCTDFIAHTTVGMHRVHVQEQESREALQSNGEKKNDSHKMIYVD